MKSNKQTLEAFSPLAMFMTIYFGKRLQPPAQEQLRALWQRNSLLNLKTEPTQGR